MMKELMDTALIKVTGGNYGDSEIEHNNNMCFYKVGDSVEKFISRAHIWTKHAVVTAVEMGWAEAGHIWNRSFIEAPIYSLVYDDGTTDIASSNDIER